MRRPISTELSPLKMDGLMARQQRAAFSRDTYAAKNAKGVTDGTYKLLCFRQHPFHIKDPSRMFAAFRRSFLGRPPCCMSVQRQKSPGWLASAKRIDLYSSSRLSITYKKHPSPNFVCVHSLESLDIITPATAVVVPRQI